MRKQSSTSKQTQQTIFELMSERKRFKYEFRDKLDYTPLIPIVEYWRDHERSKYRDTYKKEIAEMLEHNIIPKTFANGKAFTVGGLRHISHKAIVDYINGKDEWSESKKKHIADCYTELIKWLDEMSFG